MKSRSTTNGYQEEDQAHCRSLRHKEVDEANKPNDDEPRTTDYQKNMQPDKQLSSNIDKDFSKHEGQCNSTPRSIMMPSENNMSSTSSSSSSSNAVMASLVSSFASTSSSKSSFASNYSSSNTSETSVSRSGNNNISSTSSNNDCCASGGTGCASITKSSSSTTKVDSTNATIAASIQQSFDKLSSMDLAACFSSSKNNSNKRSRSSYNVPPEFYCGTGSFYTKKWSQEEKDELIDFADRIITKGLFGGGGEMKTKTISSSGSSGEEDEVSEKNNDGSAKKRRTL